MGGIRLPKGPSTGEAILERDLKIKGIHFEREVMLVTGRKFRTDFLLRGHRIAIEVDGATWVNGRHTRGSGYQRDCIKANAIVLEGYRLLRYTTSMVASGAAINEILLAIGASET